MGKVIIEFQNGKKTRRLPVRVEYGFLVVSCGSRFQVLLNPDLIPVGREEEVAAAGKSGVYPREMLTWALKIGDNGWGRIVRWEEDVKEEKKIKNSAYADFISKNFTKKEE